MAQTYLNKIKYALVGNNVLNNYSIIIHNCFGNNEYETFSYTFDDLVEILKSKNFLGINITKPYKEKCMAFLDEVSDIAKEIGAINVIINKNNKLIGYNTDFEGLKYLLHKNNIDLSNKVVGILGTGGSAKTICYLANKYNAKKVYFISRKEGNDNLIYHNAHEANIEILFNATPIGMFPNNYEQLNIDFSKFKELKAYIDLNYNPHNNRLMQAAKRQNIEAINGIDMLIEQARISEELFFDKKINMEINNNIKKKLQDQKTNICLIGMPYSGKTIIGKELAKLTNKSFIDLDEYIAKNEGFEIGSLIKIKGEKYFRECEFNAIKEISNYHNFVISTGGGSILNEENILNLRQNGYLFLLKRDLNNICFDSTRPLTATKEQYIEVYKARKELYEKYADCVIDNNSSIADTMKSIKEKYDEIINN